jgi:hypothetical protein
MNWDKEDDVGGLCENMRRHSKVTGAELQGKKAPPDEMKMHARMSGCV